MLGIKFENGHERALRHLHGADLAHTFLAFCFSSNLRLRVTSPP